ncbi:uncharacterized protein [Ptychodera flava]|uniref:uncharacterized protein n=1 Tax=Ptychodera flava TaxID=63121 RepID=UPI00396A3A67
MLEFPSVTVCNTNKLRKSAVRNSIYNQMLILESNFVPAYYADCGDDQFRCDSGSEHGVCIPTDLLCDTISQCYGGEDEDNCDECEEPNFRCLASSECINNLKVCDGTYDCRDGSDESGSICEPELKNVARGKATSLTGPILENRDSNLAVDGYTYTCVQTDWIWEPLWSVDLGKNYLVYKLKITHRATYDPKLVNAEIRVGLAPKAGPDNPICVKSIQEHETQTETFIVRCNPVPVAGRHVFIQVKGKTEDMRLCEVEVLATDLLLWNLASDKIASQSSIYAYGSAIKAIDGDKTNDYSGRSCTHTQKEYQPWWKVDLGGEYEIHKVIITNRADCCGDRLYGAVVRVGNNDAITNNTQCGQTIATGNVNSQGVAAVECFLQGRFVSVQLENREEYLSLCELEVMGQDIAEELSNVAYGKPAEQSSTYYEHVASRAVDGNENFALETGHSCIHSAKEAGAWWRVDLLKVYSVYKVVMINRYDCCRERASFVVGYSVLQVLSSLSYP